MKNLSVSLTPTEKVLGFGYWGLQLLVIPAALSLVIPYFHIALSETQLNFAFFALNFLCMTVIMHRFLGQSAKLGFARPLRVLQSAFFGFALFWVSSIAMGMLFTYLIPDFANVNDASIAQMATESYTLTAIGTVLLAPVAEELMYRGVIFGTLYGRSRFLAHAVTCILFAAIHVVGYIGYYTPLTLLLCFVQYIPAGLCLSWAYVRSGNIFAPILMHIAVNQTTIMTMR